MKNEISVGSKQSVSSRSKPFLSSLLTLIVFFTEPICFREISLTTVSQPFVNPGDAFSVTGLNSGPKTP
jgi:hypothetical protein